MVTHAKTKIQEFRLRSDPDPALAGWSHSICGNLLPISMGSNGFGLDPKVGPKLGLLGIQGRIIFI